MSLVAYDSSDDSDRDESPASALRPAGKIGGLFASLPAPKTADPTSAPQPKRMTMGLSKPKKRAEPVKITVPAIKPADVSFFQIF